MHLHNINFHARLRRHARNVNAFQSQAVVGMVKKFKVISLIIALILPIYPSFGSVGANQEYAVGAYDENSIITAYDGSEEDTSIALAQESGFIRPGKLVDGVRDIASSNKLVVYTVASGESIGSIADKFGIPSSAILWSNDLSSDSIIKPGQKIKIPPSSGLIYTVAPGDSVSQIATKFKIDSVAILEKNELDPTNELKIGQQLFLPGAKKLVEPVLAKATSKTTPKKFTPTKAAKKPAASYSVAYTGKGNRFAYGNCTYYVANHKNVTWRGNAKDWLRNAAAAGVSTGKTPAKGAIIVFRGAGYNPYYGHVGIVADVDGDDLIIKDMNYRRYNEITIRRISKDEGSIQGYIYTD